MTSGANQVAAPDPVAVCDPPLPLRPSHAGEARRWMAEADRAMAEAGLAALRDAIARRPALREFLAAALSLSPFLRDCALVDPAALQAALARPQAESLALLTEEARNSWRGATEKELMARLRGFRRRAALLIGLADLGGWWVGAQVTVALTAFADACLRSATDFLLAAAAAESRLALPDPAIPSKGSGLIVLAMGKYGAGELNYSSDIDLILLFDPAPVRDGEAGPLYVRFAKSLIRILQERTGDGYVFRVDLRLRPDPGSTPLAVPVETALQYYEAYGQNWERAALIKARAAAGDIAAGEEFLARLAPFIWRRHLDFAAISDVHSIKRQIHAHRGHGEIAVAGHNIKLGRGGIREIEFFAQTQQLIAGGRNPALREPRTVEALAALAAHGWISPLVRDRLKACYWYLRGVEHRIQMVADEQSHELPADAAGLKRIAALARAKSAGAFAERMTRVLKTVERCYAGLFEAQPALSAAGGNLVFTGGEDDPATVETLSALGYVRPPQVIETVRGWHFGRSAAVRSAQARELLTELTPGLLDAVAATGQPDATLFAFDRFLSGLPAGIQLFSLLKSNSGLLNLLLLILGSAPRLARIVTHRPHVFDGLLDPAFGGALPSRAALAERLAGELARARDHEGALDIARAFAAEQKFLIGVRLINRSVTFAAAASAFSDLADVMVGAMLDRVRREFAGRHGDVAGGRICILGMGRLGSRELTAGSDLDLLLLYDHDANAEQSDGEKPLPPSLYFLRFTQRLIAAMSAPTGEGVVYELDFRLRPSGKAGPLATHIDAFRQYQMEEAWTWERQALTRARPVAGDAALGRRAALIVGKVLARGIEGERLKSDIREMRALIDKEKATDNPFDVKTAKGGFIDVEFVGQYAALAQGRRPAGEAATSIPAMLRQGAPALFGANDAEALAAAHEIYGRVLQLNRVCLDEPFDPATAPEGLKRMLCLAFDLPTIEAVGAHLAETQADVRRLFDRLI